MTEKTESKKKFKVPHPIILLFCIVIIMSICTYLVPSGEYTRVFDEALNRNIVDPTSYHPVEGDKIGLMDFFMAFPEGMAQAQDIIFFIFIVGGAFQIITATGTIEASIGKLANTLKDKGIIIIPIILFVLSLGGATFGMAEETIVLVPIGVAMARALGYDALVGAAMVYLGAACGFNSGVMNPFTVGVAQGIAELPTFSGFGLRAAVLVIMVAITSIFLMRYALKVKNDPSKSIIYDLELQEKDSVIDTSSITQMNTRHVLTLLVVVAGFAVIINGVFKYGWYIAEIGSTFLAMGLIAGIVGGLKANDIASEFLKGAGSIVTGALMVGVARAILVVMQQGMIIDTVIYSMASAIQALPKTITVLGMYVFQLLLNFFIPSGSGQAAATMPIMVPLSDVLSINRQVAVLAFQFGDGFTNSIFPTSASLIAGLSIAKINYEKWVKFILPLMGLWILAGAIILIGANLAGYGPF